MNARSNRGKPLKSRRSLKEKPRWPERQRFKREDALRPRCSRLRRSQSKRLLRKDANLNKESSAKKRKTRKSWNSSRNRMQRPKGSAKKRRKWKGLGSNLKNA